MQLTETHQKYADLLIHTVLDFEPGQCLHLSAEPVHWPFLSLLAETAYRAGARYVQVDAPDLRLARARVDHSREEYLDYLPDSVSTRIDEMTHKDWPRIRIGGSEFPELMAGADAGRLTTVQRKAREISRASMLATGAGRIPWCVAAMPTEAWAAQIFDCPPSPEAAERLWQVMIPILLLDQPDPGAAWKELAASIGRRSQHLTDAGLDYLHFEAEGTDLKVHLIPDSHWLGGTLTNPDTGRKFIPNLPTLEAFSTPMWQKTEGRVQITRPVEVLSGQVEGAWFEFKEGGVVNYGARSGKDRLDAYFEVDAQARFLGEVALVDGNSPIYQSGLTFHNILYDENASCHIALGSGYPTPVPGSENLTEAERSELGVNQSLVHTDFMFGSESICVTGYTPGGQAVPIMVKGQFCPDFV